MSPERRLSNIASWDLVKADLEQPNAGPRAWKTMANRVVADGMALGLNGYFRAGQSMHHLIFSTLGHHGLLDEPRVTLEMHPPDQLRIAYGTTNLWFGKPQLEYCLPYHEGFATFRRFLKQLWEATVPEPFPVELIDADFSAPVLTPRC